MTDVQKLSRRNFIKTAAFSAAALLRNPAFPLSAEKKSSLFLEDIGVCASLDTANLAWLTGCAYIEESVRRLLMPEETEEKFQASLNAVKSSRLPVPVCNIFLPGSMKCVGREAKPEAILSYTETAFRRANRLGIQIIVFGSGESRKIPDGLEKAHAEAQFVGLCNSLAAIAEKYRIMIALEHLNRGETNFINNLSEGVQIVEKVNHPNFKMLADIYHMLKENEKPEAIEKWGEYIVHCHIAEKENRTPPGTEGDDFRPYLKALKKIRYPGRLSMECRWNDFEIELPAAVAEIKKQIGDVA